MAATASEPSWTPRRWQSLGGPEGGSVNAFAVASNGDLYAGTQSGGVYRLPSGGSTWAAVNSGLYHTDYGKVYFNVFDLCFASNGDLYAATNEGEVYRLPSGGSQWQEMSNDGLPGTINATAIRVVGSDVFIGTNGGGMYKLASGSTTWTALNTGLPSGATTTVNALAVTSSSTLLAATNAGPYALPSGTTTWAIQASGLTKYLMDVIVDGATGRIWAATFDSGAYYLNSGAGTWTAAPGMQNPYMMSLALDTNGDLYAGLQSGGCCGGVDRLPSGSGSWVGSSNLQTGLDIYRQGRAAAFAGGKLYLGTSRGVFRFDSGPAWTAMHSGMSAFKIGAILRRSSGQVLVGTEGGGVFAYQNGSWSPFNSGVDAFTLPAEVTQIVETAGGHLFLALRGVGVGRYLRRMPNGTSSWAEFDTGITGVSNAEVLALAYNGTDGYVYSGMAGVGGVFRTTPTGSSWTNLSTGLTDLRVASLLAASDGSMYTGTIGSGVFRLPLGNTTWTEFNAGATQKINSIALGQNVVTNDLWATYGDNENRFPAGGSAWVADSVGFFTPTCPAPDVHAFSSSSTGVMWAANLCGVARRKHDESTWEYFNQNLFPPDQGVNTSFAFSPAVHASGGGVYAGMQGLAVKYLPYTRLIWRNTSSYDTHLWVMNGGTFVSGVVMPFAGAGWNYERWVDMDGDGNVELIVRNPSLSQTHVWELDDRGNVSTGYVLPQADSNWTIIAADDFNGDGKTDLIWRHTPSQQVHMWLMDGATILSGAVLPAGAGWQIDATGDMNGDGKSDLVWRYAAISQTHAWYMNGTTMASGAVLPTAGPDWQIETFGDYDGDGATDLIWRNVTLGQAHMWMMSGTTIKSGAVMPGVSNVWIVVSAGDYDGDGRTDLVWRNTSTYEAHMWLMNGSSISSGAVLPTTGSGWALVP